MKNGYYFMIDAILASLLLIGGLVILVQYSQKEDYTEQTEFFSQDLLTVLSSIKIYELNETNKNNSFIVSEINSGNITNTQNTLLEQLGEYWARNESDKARILLDTILTQIETDKSFEIIISNAYRTDYDTVYNTSFMNHSETITTSRRMISGIEKGSPLSGTTSSAYLKKIVNKKTFSYAYFGGFVGQGNITVPLTLLSDYNGTNLLYATLKIQTPGNFTLYINDQQCLNNFYGSENITNEIVSEWDVSECKDMMRPLNNTINIRFTSSLETAYIAGGFFKASYVTQSLSVQSVSGYKRYYFPDINGLINLYDAISAQGNIQNWTLNLTFYNTYSTYFNLGNDTLFILPGNDTLQNIIYSRINQNLAEEPIPIRLGIQNFTNVTTVSNGLPADTFLITDVSGSMSECIGSARNCSYQYQKIKNGPYFPLNCMVNDVNLCNGNPDNPCGGNPFYKGRNYVAACNQSRMEVAKTADTTFVNIILNSSLQHRIGLEDFSTSSHTITSLTNNGPILINEINTYVASGATCSCCGINIARDSINSSTNKKYLIFLSDGDPTLYCQNLSDYSGSNVWGGDTSTGSSSELDINWTIKSGQAACADNITVYTIGFGTGMSAQGIDTMKKTACNYSLYFNATDITQLNDIFQNISQDILLAANFSSQTVTIIGNYSPSRLYGNSYIDIYYDPVLDTINQQNKIVISAETPQFNSCNTSIYIPSNIEVTDAFVTSYSGNHWTKNLLVNDFDVYNLTKYGSNYESLGDPFLIEIPSVIINSGAYNNISLQVGDSSSNNSECSNNNTLIYDFLVNSTVSRSLVLQQASGCIWTIEFEDYTNSTSTIPQTYSGSDKCNYTGSSRSWKDYDAYDVSVSAILHQLDFDDNGKVDINLNTQDLEVIITTVESVPYLWGPSIIEVRVWK